MLLFGALAPHAQLSVAHSEAAVARLHSDNPFFHRQALNDTTSVGVDASGTGTDARNHPSLQGCPAAAAYDLHLAWTTKLGASVYSSPLLVPSSTDGAPNVWANTFVRYAEALDGQGHELPGWPYAFSRSTFHSSPLKYDIDGDGNDEMLLLTFDAEAVFLSERGLPMRGHGFKLPKLKVRKDWFEGLHDIHTTPYKRETHGALVQHDADDDNEDDEGDEDDAEGATAGAGGGGAAAAASDACLLYTSPSPRDS